MRSRASGLRGRPSTRKRWMASCAHVRWELPYANPRWRAFSDPLLSGPHRVRILIGVIFKALALHRYSRRG